MPQITATLKENGNLLKLVYVQHIVFGVGHTITMTNNEGKFTFDGGFATEIDVRIYAQNSVVRALDGRTSNIMVSTDKRIRNGDIINIISSDDQWDHFRIINIVKDVYDKVWRLFLPYSDTSRSDFALGKKSTIRNTFASNTRIELSFPDMLNDDPESKSWVEPAGLSNNSFPLMHIRDVPSLFSTPENAWRLLAHETGHAMHFSFLSPAKRIEIEATYLAFIATHLHDSSHRVNRASSPFVALIEAIGIFSERFFFYTTFIQPGLTRAALMRAFVDDELGAQSLEATMPTGRYFNVGKFTNSRVTPELRGNDIEGAVYGAIFVDFANRIGLRNVLAYLKRSEATTFSEYRNFIRNHGGVPEHTRHINAVRNTWNM